MATQAKKKAGAKGAAGTARRKVAKKPAARPSAPKPRTTRKKAQGGSMTAARKTKVARAKPATRAMPAGDAATEDDLLRLRDATKGVFERLRAIDDDALPAERKEEYWRDRHIARTAWEHAENAVFANLVEQQKQQLPAVSASNAKLARDVATTATIIDVLNVVSAGLGILASVIALLA